MAAAVASTAVEPTATAAMETTAAVEAAVAAAETFMTVESTAPVVAATSVETTAVITAASVEGATIVATVEPRAGADEDAADEVVRTVVAVGRACVRIVAVVTVSAGGRWPDRAVHRTYSDAHGKLRVSACRCKKQNCQQSNIF